MEDFAAVEELVVVFEHAEDGVQQLAHGGDQVRGMKAINAFTIGNSNFSTAPQ